MSKELKSEQLQVCSRDYRIYQKNAEESEEATIARLAEADNEVQWVLQREQLEKERIQGELQNTIERLAEADNEVQWVPILVELPPSLGKLRYCRCMWMDIYCSWYEVPVSNQWNQPLWDLVWGYSSWDCAGLTCKNWILRSTRLSSPVCVYLGYLIQNWRAGGPWKWLELLWWLSYGRFHVNLISRSPLYEDLWALHSLILTGLLLASKLSSWSSWNLTILIFLIPSVTYLQKHPLVPFLGFCISSASIEYPQRGCF